MLTYKYTKEESFLYICYMATLTIEIPETVDIDKRRVSMIVASKLYEQGRLSLGQASDVAGLTKRAFIELLSDYGVSIFNFPVSDLSKEMANA
jgi:predicted HTH domain antitoxin